MISSLKLKSNTTARRALVVSADKLAIYHWAKNKLGSSYLFDTSSEGLEYFEQYLKQFHHDPVYILIDTAIEEYRLDTIPHVFGADRAAILERKQDRLFRGTPYLYAEVQGREEEGRRDDKVMLSAITNPEIIQPCLNILEKHKVPVASVVSIPLLIQDIANSIPEISDNALIFSLQSMSGLRQSFYRDKSLKFSRLVKIPRYGTESYAPILTEELEKVRRYIESSHLLDHDKPLDIYFLGNKELLEELGKTHINAAMVRYHLLSVNDLCEPFGLDENLETPFSDKYFVCQLLKHKCKNYFALVRDRRYFQMRMINRSLRVASLLLILGGLGWSGLNVLQGFVYKQQYASDAKKIEFYNARYEVARERISTLPVEPADLKIVVDGTEVLKSYKAEPFDMFKLISKSLDVFPEIQISKIQWLSNTDPNHKLGKGTPNSAAGDGSQGVVGFSNISNAETGYIYYQIALIECNIDEFDGNYRKALSDIDLFAESLRQIDTVHDVSVTSLPLDISSEARLQGSAKEGKDKSNFSVRIVLGIRDEA